MTTNNALYGAAVPSETSRMLETENRVECTSNVYNESAKRYAVYTSFFLNIVLCAALVGLLVALSSGCFGNEHPFPPPAYHGKDIAGAHNRIWMNPDLRDALYLITDKQHIETSLNQTLNTLIPKLNRAFTSNNFVNVSGYQVTVSFGCFDIVNYASGWGYKVKNVSCADKFLPMGAHLSPEMQRGGCSSWQSNFERKDDISPATPFRIGSITKVFTSMLAFILRDEGIVSLDDEFAKLWPEMSVENLYKDMNADEYLPDRNFTLRMAMSHMTGVKRDTSPDLMSKDLIRDMKKYSAVTYPANFHIEYNNFMTSLVGQFLANKTGESYASLVEKYILNPLGMNETFMENNEHLYEEYRIGHDLCRTATDADYVRVSQDYGSLYDMNPAGSMISTSRDMITFAKAINPESITHPTCQEMLSDARLNTSPSSSMKTLARASTLREYLSHGVAAGNDGLGIGISTSEMMSTFPHHYKYWSKGGAVGHFGAHLGLVPNAHLSISLTSNTMMNVPPAVLDIFQQEENLVGPVLDFMKKTLDDAYSGQYLCRGVEGSSTALMAHVYFSNLANSENPVEYHVVSFEHDNNTDSSTSSLFPFADYGMAEGAKNVMAWSGIPHLYNVFAQPSLGLFNGYMNEPTTISESMGFRYAHQLKFTHVTVGQEAPKLDITLGKNDNTQSAFECQVQA
eukprot:Nk52_evm20s225 gene=Nk52_evmTU20s225